MALTMPFRRSRLEPSACTHCRQVNLERACKATWRFDKLEEIWSMLRRASFTREIGRDRQIVLPNVSAILSEKNCSLCLLVAEALMSLPDHVHAKVSAASSFPARLLVEHELSLGESSPPTLRSRFHDQNYLKLDSEAEAIGKRSTQVRGIGEYDITNPFLHSSYIVTLQAPVHGPDSLGLSREPDGACYISVGRIVPFKERQLRSFDIRYANYSGCHFGSQSDTIRVERWKGWLKECCATCISTPRLLASNTTLPGFSLIDTTTGELVNAPLGMQYAALSYVWGNQSTAIDAQAVSHVLPKGRYPRTIQDAIIFSMKLGVKYLWVDAVCIPPDPAQRAEQIRRMDAIYECAVVVIIAASSEHSDFGLHGVSLLQKKQIWARFGDMKLIFRPYDYADCIAKSSWSTRGWCFQEGLLAQRRFILTDQEVFFECERGLCHESQADFKPFIERGRMNPILNIFQTNKKRAFHGQLGNYSHVVTAYLNKSLTRESDILDAFAGLANSLNFELWPGYFHHKKDDIFRYLQSGIFLPQGIRAHSCWGLPFNFFLMALTWEPILNIQQSPGRRSLDIPSWSWAAWRIKGITYTRDMFKVDPMSISFSGSEKDWIAALDTRVIEFDAEIVFFRDGIEEARDEYDLGYDLRPSWSSAEGSFLSMVQWAPGAPGASIFESIDTISTGDWQFRFALRVKKHGDFLYRVGHELIPMEEWTKRNPQRIRARLR